MFLHSSRMRLLVTAPRFLFSQTSRESYFLNKIARQKEKILNSFCHDPAKLKELTVNMKELSPNFFTKCLPMFEAEKTIQEDKSANVLDNSYIAVELPVESEPDIRSSLRKLMTNEMRIGRMMELMDSIAGLVGYRHCFGSLSTSNPFILVTGSVDSINLF